MQEVAAVVMKVLSLPAESYPNLNLTCFDFKGWDHRQQPHWPTLSLPIDLAAGPRQCQKCMPLPGDEIVSVVGEGGEEMLHRRGHCETLRKQPAATAGWHGLEGDDGWVRSAGDCTHGYAALVEVQVRIRRTSRFYQSC
jgi:hypothetical protein